VAERYFGQQAPATRGATVEPGHLGAGAGLVDEHELIGIDEGLCRPPDTAPSGNVRPVLLGHTELLLLFEVGTKPPQDGMRRVERYNLSGALAADRRQDRQSLPAI